MHRSTACTLCEVENQLSVPGDDCRSPNELFLMAVPRKIALTLLVGMVFTTSFSGAAYSQSTKINFADHTLRVLNEWTSTINANGDLVVTPHGYKKANGMHKLVVRTEPTEGRANVADAIEQLKNDLDPKRILKEGELGIFKYPTKWIVVDNAPSDDLTLMRFVSATDGSMVTIDFSLSRERWKHCLSTAIKTAQTLDR